MVHWRPRCCSRLASCLPIETRTVKRATLDLLAACRFEYHSSQTELVATHMAGEPAYRTNPASRESNMEAFGAAALELLLEQLQVRHRPASARCAENLPPWRWFSLSSKTCNAIDRMQRPRFLPLRLTQQRESLLRVQQKQLLRQHLRARRSMAGLATSTNDGQCLVYPYTTPNVSQRLSQIAAEGHT